MLNDKRKVLKADLTELERKEASYSSQRAKKLWIKEGNENSGFFHRVCSVQQKRNLISKVIDDKGIEHTSNYSIAETFMSHFDKIYNSPTTSKFLIDNLDWRSINNNHHLFMCCF